jgi:hypothetical protein
VLLRRSVRHLAPVVDVLASSPPQVWMSDADDYSDEVCTLLLEVGRRLRAAFPEGASDILVTKIMLGVFGCVPAFDANFKRGFGLSAFNHRALRRLGQFYDANAEIIERNRVPTLDFDTGGSTDRLYSRAKVIDMIFFVEGQGT